MEILWGCGLGKNLQRILERFWEAQTVVPRARVCYGCPFKTDWGVTQGETVSPTIFNIVVNVLVRSIILEVCGPQED